MNTVPIVSKVWSFCTTLRDDGVGYGDYLEQFTYLIFLKMAGLNTDEPVCQLRLRCAEVTDGSGDVSTYSLPNVSF